MSQKQSSLELLTSTLQKNVPESNLRTLLWKNSLYHFSYDVLSIRPPHTLDTPAYIKDWYRVLEDKKVDRLVRMAPRSHAKSQTHTINYILWEIYKNPDIRIIIASKTASMAGAFAREIRERLESQPEFAHLVPDKNTAQWTDTQFTVNRTRSDKNSTVTATGANSSILSKRADIIVCDDIVSEENSRTPAQREKLDTWFWKTLYPVLEPEGRLIVVGTRWHYADFYGTLLGDADYPKNEYFEKDGWLCMVQQAILNEETKEVLWKDRWSYAKLDKIRRRNLAIFNCGYQNDPTGLVGQKFKWDWFKWYEIQGENILVKNEEMVETIAIKDLKIYIGIDPAISQSDQADYFSLVVIGLDKANRVFVLDYVNDRLTFNGQIEAVFKKIDQWAPIKIAVETVSYQKALKQELDRISIERRLYTNIKEIKTNKDKVTRSAKLSGMFENGLIFLKKQTMGTLSDTLLQFPKGDHDDLFDGLDFAIEAAELGESEPALQWV